MPHTTTLVRRIRRTAQTAYLMKMCPGQPQSGNDAYRDGKPCTPGILQAEYETACDKMIPGNCKDPGRIRKLAMRTMRD